jgi:serine/threonine-protein kinase
MDRESIGPYRLLRLLGKGGMGAVYEAVHQTIERRAAIKILHSQFASQKEYSERFLNEARAANRIGHPSIVEIYDLGSLADGTTYLVMEYLDGETVGKRLQRHGGKLPLLDLLWIGNEIASAVRCAHDKGIIHRDLKPDNVMLIADPANPRGERVKLLDFGIAKLGFAGADSKAATLVGTVMGTLSYMPPEQLRDTSHVSDRADVYALGALLYHLASGRPPFVANNDIDLMVMHLRDDVLSVREFAPETPEPLAQLIERMLAKDPLQRPSMEEVEKELAQLRREIDATATGPQPRITGPRSNPPTPATLVQRLPKTSGPLVLAGYASSESAGAGIVAPSASTLSRSASESLTGTLRRRVPVVAAAAGLTLILAMVLYLKVGPHSPPITPAVVGAPLAPSVIAAEGQPKAKPPDSPTVLPGNNPALDETATPQPASNPVSPAKPKAARGCQRTAITVSCISLPAGKLSPVLLESAAKAARTAGLRPCTGQKLHAIREGNGMLFEPSYLVSKDQAELFSDTLRGLLPPGRELPTEVFFKCGK